MIRRSKLEKHCVVDTTMTCRVCMKKEGPMEDLFDSESKIFEEIQFCVGILITENDNLPSSICLECLAQLSVAHNFKTTCISSHRAFQELLEDVKVEVKSEDLSLDSSILVKEENEFYDNDIIVEFIADTVRKTRPKKGKVKTTRREASNQKYRRLYCIKCELHFKNRQESLEHFQTTHKNEKWVCEICGKQYIHQSSYSAHVRTHGPSEHACGLCDYSTSHKSDLVKHLMVHTDEKKFQCHVCSNSFRTSSNLHGHIQRNHGGHKKHNCDRCDKKFYTLNRLNRHLDSHNNVKRFECEVCHARFTRRCHWKMHLQKQHSVSTPPLRPGKKKKSPVLQQKPSIFNK